MNSADEARFRALVVDDEPPARRRLQQLLMATGRVDVVVLARSVAEALEVAKSHEINVAFLDVHLPGEDGFAYVEKVPFEVPIVFVTAYSTFAVRAFEVAALDYILKPVDPLRLNAALDRVTREVRHRLSARILNDLGSATNSTREDVLCLPVTGGARFVPIGAIVCILARDDYTEVVLEDGSSELVSITMRDWEERLQCDRFTRLHRGAIAATVRIERIERLGGRWQAHLRGYREVIPVSRNVARELLGRSVRA